MRKAKRNGERDEKRGDETDQERAPLFECRAKVGGSRFDATPDASSLHTPLLSVVLFALSNIMTCGRSIRLLDVLIRTARSLWAAKPSQ